MGCDIHFYTEKKVNGKWESADKLSKNKYYDKNDPDGEQEFEIAYGDRLYDGRNYNLFAILADVRNGRGFAGDDTGDGFKPISDPKGLPEDCCDFIKGQCETWGGDGHSHSYFTVKELLEYDWTQKTTIRTIMDLRTYVQWVNHLKNEGRYPEICYTGVSGKKINEDEVLEFINKNFKPLKPFEDMDWDVRTFVHNYLTENKVGSFDIPHVKAEFQIPYCNAANELLSSTIPKLLRLGKHDEVRIVFWFDN